MSWFVPEWTVPAGVRALITTRTGGVSAAPFDSFNLGAHCGDDARAVEQNRLRLRAAVPAEPRWLRQVHGNAAVAAEQVGTAPPQADASFARHPNCVCAVLAADCLPVLLCNDAGSMVAAAHAGWRGLHQGVIEAAVAPFGEPGSQLRAYLGPAISPNRYVVGDDVCSAFVRQNPADASAFRAAGPGKFRCDLYGLARLRLERAGVTRIEGGDFCTFDEPARFYSYRRDGRTGRFAALIWMQ